jgi:PHD/YefM family antitoxin component YafN of YafNO toxin-antitoxin module
MKTVSENEFLKQVSQYLTWIEENHQDLIITSHDKPKFTVKKIKRKTFKELQGITEIKIKGDINAHVLPPYDTW